MTSCINLPCITYLASLTLYHLPCITYLIFKYMEIILKNKTNSINNSPCLVIYY